MPKIQDFPSTKVALLSGYHANSMVHHILKTYVMVSNISVRGPTAGLVRHDKSADKSMVSNIFIFTPTWSNDPI